MDWNEIIAALHGDDPDAQDAAIRSLERIGNDAAVAMLAECLEHDEWRQAKGFDPDWRGPSGERPQGRMVYEPLGHLAVKALARLVPNPPRPAPADPVTEEDVAAWKAWWERNKEDYARGAADDTES